MSRFSGWAALVLAGCALASWGGEPVKLTIPRDYLDSFLPLPERFDTPANPATDAKIALGRMLFFDRRLSENGRLACHGCHDLKATHLPVGALGDCDGELSEVVHWLPTEWPRGIFPGLELTVRAPFDGDERWRVSLIPQLHLAFSKRGHVALNLGVELPLAGARQDYRYRVHTFLLWDMADGGFWEGW